MNSRHRLALADACSAAMADAFTAWRREFTPDKRSRDAYAVWVESIDVHVQLRPGQATWIVVEVNDRRPGRSALFSYQAELVGNQQRVFRTQRST
jgi:hypothetical protein